MLSPRWLTSPSMRTSDLDVCLPSCPPFLVPGSSPGPAVVLPADSRRRRPARAHARRYRCHAVGRPSIVEGCHGAHAVHPRPVAPAQLCAVRILYPQNDARRYASSLSVHAVGLDAHCYAFGTADDNGTGHARSRPCTSTSPAHAACRWVSWYIPHPFSDVCSTC